MELRGIILYIVFCWIVPVLVIKYLDNSHKFLKDKPYTKDLFEHILLPFMLFGYAGVIIPMCIYYAMIKPALKEWKGK